MTQPIPNIRILAKKNIMSNDLRNEFNIPANHTIIQKKLKSEQRKGLDTDTYVYEEIDPQGNVVGKYIEKNSTSMYPPFEHNVTYEKA